MGFLTSIFTWWNGATIGTRLFSARKGSKIGTDELGNVYFEGGIDVHGKPRRWVIYSGANDASRVTPEWHGWLHGTHAETPDKALPPVAGLAAAAPAQHDRHARRLSARRRAGSRWQACRRDRRLRGVEPELTHA